MPTRREEVLQALLARLRTIPSAGVKREEPLPEKVPAAGLADGGCPLPRLASL